MIEDFRRALESVNFEKACQECFVSTKKWIQSWETKWATEGIIQPDFVYKDVERTVVFGDVHGDLPALQNNLYEAELINENGQWADGVSGVLVVLLGDLLDRGGRSDSVDSSRGSDEEILLMQYIEILNRTGKTEHNKNRKGDANRVRWVLGNHELMRCKNQNKYIGTQGIWPHGNRPVSFMRRYLAAHAPLVIVLDNRSRIVILSHTLHDDLYFYKNYMENSGQGAAFLNGLVFRDLVNNTFEIRDVVNEFTWGRTIAKLEACNMVDGHLVFIRLLCWLYQPDRTLEALEARMRAIGTDNEVAKKFLIDLQRPVPRSSVPQKFGIIRNNEVLHPILEHPKLLANNKNPLYTVAYGHSIVPTVTKRCNGQAVGVDIGASEAMRPNKIARTGHWEVRYGD